MRNMIMGIFENREAADNAINALQREEYAAEDISIVMKDVRNQVRQMDGNSVSVDVEKGAATGAVTGVVVGGIAGFLAGTALPALGGFLIGGPLGAALGLTGAAATTISGAATGVVAGGLLGALIGLGVPHEKAREYEQHIAEGAILVAVSADEGEEKDAKEIMDEAGAADITMIAEKENRRTRRRPEVKENKEPHRRMHFAHHSR